MTTPGTPLSEAGPATSAAERRLPQPDATPRRHSVHYSRVVRTLRILLPVVAGTALLTAALWPSLNKVESQLRQGLAPSATSQSRAVVDVRMENARFFGVDRNDRPFTVTAAQAVQLEGAPNDPRRVRLERPQADVTLAGGAWLALTAETGMFMAEENRLDLTGSVNVFHDRGYEISTTAATVDLTGGTAAGDAPVSGQGPFGLLTGQDGFEIREDGAVVEVKGRSKLVVDRLPGGDGP